MPDVPVLHHLGGSGEPVVLLHGFGSDRMSWAANQHELTRIASVHALDLPGHGKSPPPPADPTPAGLSRAVAAAIDAAGLGPVHLLGHSLGGAVALALAAADPGRVRSLMLVSPAGLGARLDRAFVDTLPEAEDAETLEPLLHRLVSRPRLINRHMVARLLSQLEGPGRREGLRQVARGIVAGREAALEHADAVAAAEIPRLVVWGDLDTVSPFSAERLDRLGGERHVVEGAAHLPHVENFKAVNELLAGFLLRTAAAWPSADD